MAKRTILDNGGISLSDWFFKDNEEHIKLLYCTKPCIYILSKSNSQGIRVYKPGYSGGAIKNTKRCTLDRITEQIPSDEDLRFTKYVIEAIIPIPDEFKVICDEKGTIPDKQIHSIMENYLGYDSPKIGNTNKKLEYYYNVNPIKLYNQIEYIVMHNGEIPLSEKNDVIVPRELQKIEVDKCLASFLSGSKEYLENAACRSGKTYMGFFICDGLYEYYKSKELLETDYIINDKVFMVLVYSIKCEVMDEWKQKCKDFGYAFITTDKSYGSLEEQYETAISNGYTKIICFASVMDLYGKDENGYVKEKNKFIHNPPHHWTLAIGDEFHFGLHNKNASNTFSIEDYNEAEIEAYENFRRYDKPIKADYFLYLTATGYASISSGRFPDNFSIVTYADMKRCVDYYAIPNIKLVAIDHNEEALKEYIVKNNKNQFSLSKLFKAYVDKNGNYKFKYEAKVCRFLQYLFDIEDSNGCLYSGSSDEICDEAMRNSIIVMDEVNSCFALANLIKKKFLYIGNHYYIHTVAGTVDAMTEKNKLIQEMKGISEGKDKYIGTITITCGKLLTGVSVEYWSSMVLLTDKTKAEFLHQSIGRLFTPHVDDRGIVLKPSVVIVDPHPNRALYFRETFDAMERAKNPALSRRESYYNLEKFIEFVSLSEKGEFKTLTYEKIVEQKVINGKHIDYLRNNGLIIGTDEDIKKAVEDYDLETIFSGKKSKAVVQSIQITSNPLIVPVSSQYIGTINKKKDEDSKNYSEIIKKIVDSLGMFCFVYDKTIETFDDLKNVPTSIFNKYFKISINAMEDIIEKRNIISKDVFEDMLNIYNTGNALLNNRVKEYIAN